MGKLLIFFVLLVSTYSIRDDLIKAFHIDCGRKYFSVSHIKDIINTLNNNDYNYLEMAIGNEGLRFILDDMSLTIGKKTYSSDEVKEAVKSGIKHYTDYDTNAYTQSEMNEIINYANQKGVSIIPLINTPGHMNSILYACNLITGIDCSYDNSRGTIDVTNEEATKFTLALVKKYIEYFKSKKVKMFNMGGDEYANDIYETGSRGFGHLVETGNYGKFIIYMNQMSLQVKESGLRPIAFNDGFYFGGEISSGELDKDIFVAYWSSGSSEYRLFPAKELEKMGYKFLNTNSDWYYVLNWKKISDDRHSFEKDTLPGVRNTPYDEVVDGGKMIVNGSLVCFWCDEPVWDYTSQEKDYLHQMIAEFAKANPTIFKFSSAKSIKFSFLFIVMMLLILL